MSNVTTTLKLCRKLLESYSVTKEERATAIYEINNILGDRFDSPVFKKMPKPIGRPSSKTKFKERVIRWIEENDVQVTTIDRVLSEALNRILVECSKSDRNTVATILDGLGWKNGEYAMGEEGPTLYGYAHPDYSPHGTFDDWLKNDDDDLDF